MSRIKVIIFVGFLPIFVSSQCIISINRDVNQYQPLILKPGTWPTYGNHPYYLPGNRDGDIMFDSNQEIVLHCPGGPIRYGQDERTDGILEITCENHRNFQVTETGDILPFTSLTCVTPAQHSVRRTGQKCNGTLDVLEVGFRLNDGKWLTQITICFDPACKRTVYAQSHMSARIDASQQGVPRRPFTEGGSFFNLGVDVERDCYYIPRQRVNINRQLSLPEQSYAIIDRGDTVLTRGHLVPKGDYVYGRQQDATFYFVNAAPQWKNLNGGNWNELELSVRRYASNARKDLVIYTGTHEIAVLNDVVVFLHRDKVMGHIPVPKYFWKVVYDPVTELGVAFVSMNNPYENNPRPFCNNVCGRINWPITWNTNDRIHGFSFCCDVNEFRRYVHLPEFTVRGLLNN